MKCFSLALAVIIAVQFGQVPRALGDEALWRDCRTCHRVEAPDGTVLARGGRAGPNLYGVPGSPLGSDSEFRLYSPDMMRAARSGARWTRANFVAYLSGPDKFLRDLIGSELAESGMHVAQRRSGPELFNYLRRLSR